MNERPVMIVEDDIELSELFADILESVGLEAEIYRDGKKAMERLADLTPRVVILDLHIPSVSGTQILIWMRAQARLKDTKVILVSADPQMMSSLSALADMELVKPVTIDQITRLTLRLMKN